MAKQLLTTLLFFLSFFLSAQYPALRIVLTGTAETCLNNGSLTWTTSGQSSGATVVYSIYNNAVTTVNTTTTSSTLSGLPAGSYRVIVTETIGSQSSQATSNNFTIVNHKVSLAFRATLINNEICGNDGSFEVNISSGRAPYRYQLLKPDNSILVDQVGKTFSNLSAGNYKYRVIDACGNGLTGQQEITYNPSSFQQAKVIARPVACNQLSLMIFEIFASLKYPLTVTASYTNPVTLLKEETTEDNILQGKEEILIPFFPTESFFAVDVTIKDACGKTYILPTKTIDQSIYHRVITSNAVCGSKSIKFELPGYANNVIQAHYRIKFLRFPEGFDPVAMNPKHGELAYTHTYGVNTSARVPFGTYNYEVYDDCGRKTPGTFIVEKVPFAFNFQGLQEVCGTGLYNGRTLSNEGYTFAESRITKAPQEFIDKNGPLPFQIPDSWYYIERYSFAKSIFFDGLPTGSYELEATETCYGDTAFLKFTAAKLEPPRTEIVSAIVNCNGTFRLRSTTNNSFYLQKYFPSKGQWGTSETSTQIPGSGSVPLWHTFTNTDISYGPGRYRIISRLDQYPVKRDNGDIVYYTCDPVAEKEFTVGEPLIFTSAHAFECSNGTYDVTLNNTGGLLPVQYSIVDSESNNAATIKNNGINPIFEGLPPGIYYFRITDDCGTFTTRKMDIALLGKPGIRTQVNCITNEVVLAIDNLDYLNFQWFKNDNPSNILSTKNTLNLGAFTADKAGEYSLRIKTNSPTSCINSTFNINLRPDALTNAEAGTGQVVNINYDGTQTKLNLFNYLIGTFDTYGTWTETTTLPSNLLVQNEWLVRSAQAGTYTFKYTVTPLCGGVEKSSFVTINLAKVCYKPAVLSGTTEETKFGITLLGRAGAKNDNWPMVRKGGWMALEANTKGFVLNRVAFNSNNLPVGIPVANFVEGMIVFDTTNQCMKIYNGTVWSCFSTQTCPE